MQAKHLSICFLFLFSFHTSVKAQEGDSTAHKEERFSHKGIKGAISSASFEMTSERNLNEGEGAALSLGYGFTDKFTLWLTLLGSEHKASNSPDTEFGGLEINVQHKFKSESKFQPYAKIGGGIYGLEEKNSNVSLIGAGINLGLGLDYFFSKHWGVGAEIAYKKLDYFKENRRVDGGEFITDLNPALNGDTVAFMLTLTVQ